MADITGIITVVDFFTFYQLVLDGHTIHLSFTEKKHRKAVKQLQKLSRQIDYLPQRQMSAGELAAMLSRQRSFAEFGQSTFIQAGTVFQQQVWQLISRIPFGETRTYGDLAKRLDTAVSSSSPITCPKVSLIFLKRSRSRNSSATLLPLRSALFIAIAKRSRSSKRLGNPVSGS